MQLTFFALTICLDISIYRIYKWLCFYIDTGCRDIYSRSEILLEKLFILSLCSTSCFASTVFSESRQ